jgi:cobalt-zinc-cadmium efflux system membrane fusion protein
MKSNINHSHAAPEWSEADSATRARITLPDGTRRPDSTAGFSSALTIVWTILCTILFGCAPSGEEPPAQARDEQQQAAEADGGEAYGSVTLSEAAIENANFSEVEVKRRNLDDAISVPAEVRYDPDLIAHISSITSGIVEAVPVNVGDDVEENQRLATLRSVAVGNARAKLARARSAVRIAQRNYERQQQLRDANITSERALLEAEMALDEANADLRAARSELEVYASAQGSGSELILESPIAGTVIERTVNRGEAVDTNQRLMTIADTSTVWIIGQVFGEKLDAIEEGMAATFRLSSGIDKEWDGTISYISPVAEGNSRAVDVRMEVDNAEGRLRVGLYGSLWFAGEGGEGEGALTVPDSAIQTSEGTTFVFSPQEDTGSFRVISISTGESMGGYTEVINGLEEGTIVIGEGSFILKSEFMRDQLGSGHAH